jgi:hypothetical protein
VVQLVIRRTVRIKNFRSAASGSASQADYYHQRSGEQTTKGPVAMLDKAALTEKTSADEETTSADHQTSSATLK